MKHLTKRDAIAVLVAVMTIFCGGCRPTNEGRTNGSLPNKRTAPSDQVVWKQHSILDTESAGVTAIAFAPDSGTLAAAVDSDIQRWNVTDWQASELLSGHDDALWCLAYSPDGDHIASGGTDQTVRVWDARSGKMTAKLSGYDDWINQVAFSPDGAVLATASGNPFSARESLVVLWDIASGTRKQKIVAHSGRSGVKSVAFSPKGNMFATTGGQDDRSAKLWDANRGRELLQLDGEDLSFGCVAFSPDGALLATGNIDGTVRLWDPFHGTQQAHLEGHNAHVQTIAFAADGLTLASSSESELILWTVASNTVRQTLTCENAEIAAIQFSADGRYLAAGTFAQRTDSDESIGRIWIWEASREELAREASP